LASNLANHNLLSDLKTPDKNVFDFNSVVSGNKNYTQGKFSHEKKFQINSNSVEKFLQKKGNPPNVKMADAMIFSDNKRQSINAEEFKKIIQQNQVQGTFSDEK
jgi:hypothetical protein